MVFFIYPLQSAQDFQSYHEWFLHLDFHVGIRKEIHFRR